MLQIFPKDFPLLQIIFVIVKLCHTLPVTYLQKWGRPQQDDPSPHGDPHRVPGRGRLPSPTPTTTQWQRPPHDPSEPQVSSSGLCDWSHSDRGSWDTRRCQHSELVKDGGLRRWPQEEKQGTGTKHSFTSNQSVDFVHLLHDQLVKCHHICDLFVKSSEVVLL